MATWYCDYTNGDDATGSGTSGAPWKTLQKAVNSATGGDTINVANTSAQVLAANITWNTGWTANNAKVTTIQAWDNGGSITIQRPDESTARVAASLDGSGTIATAFSQTSIPTRLYLKDIKVYGFTSYQITISNESGCDGCEISGSGTSGRAGLSIGIYAYAYNCYIHSLTDPANALLAGTNSNIDSNYISATLGANTRSALRIDSESIAIGNIVKLIGVGRGINFTTDSTVKNNTIIGDGSNSDQRALVFFGERTSVLNNVVYDFSGASASVYYNLGTSEPQRIIGNNLLVDCVAATIPTHGAGYIYADTTDTGDPFVDSASNDYTLLAAYRDTGLGNPNSSIDVGAIQSASTGGGATTRGAAWVG